MTIRHTYTATVRKTNSHHGRAMSNMSGPFAASGRAYRAHDVLAVEQLFHLRGRVAHLGYGTAQLVFAAIELFSPPADFARVVQVDQSAVGGNGFEDISHGLVLLFLSAPRHWTPPRGALPDRRRRNRL